MEGRNFFYEEDRLEERRRETAELRRLLYVAMTRARRSLCLSGSFPLGEGGFPTLGAALDKKKKDRAKKDEEQGFRPLEGDSILDNGSFFGLLLPTLCEPRPWLEEGKFREGAPPYLAMELIPPLGPQILEKRKERGYANGPSGLARFFRDRLPLYSGGAVISTPVLRDDHLSPSAVGEFLKSGGAGHPITEGAPCPSQAPGLSPSVPPLFRHDPALSGGGAEDIFALADPILSRTGAFAEFGSLVHLCAEARLTGKTERLPPGLAGRLRPGEAETLLEAGRGIAGRFLASPLGIQAAGAARRWNEYPFRSLWETGGEASRESSGPWTGESGGVFVNGVIDLLYEWEEELRIADFKTDSEERPEEHLAQMAIYRRAARELQGKPCRVWLYYLRSGRAVEVTDFCL
jgi:ATP-dependent helicase/nuclease subunit A